MPHRVTLTDLAKAAGVSKASVSFALNGHPKVSEELRERVKKLAVKLGYKRDPVLARIASSRWRSPHAPVGTVLAFVALPRPMDFADGGRRVLRPQNYPEFAAAAQRADDLGYRMEFFNYGVHADAEKLAQVLRNRGIPGVVLGPIYENEFVERFRWEWFASVAIFDGYVAPPVDQFTPSYVHALQTGWARAQGAGFKRPGLVLFREQREHHINFVLVSAMEHLQRGLPATARVPVHYYETPAKLAEWRKKHTPDVVIGYNDAHYWALREAGVDVPGTTAYLSLLRSEPAAGQTNPAAGVAISHRELAGHAVDRLDSMLRRGETGLPEFPFVHRMIGPWRDGESFPAAW
jgi:LacI family transcriptional regulator